MSTSFNYVDAFNNSSQFEYENKQHDTAVELQGRKCYIFLLDREKTETSEIYNEAIGARIYLPHFEQRALYKLNEWVNNIGLNNFVEQEDTLEFEFNFSRMVCNIRDLKDKKSGVLTIQNKSEELLHLVIENEFFSLRTSKSVILLEADLTKFKSIKQFINYIESKCSLVSFSYEGDMEEARNISSINVKLKPNKKETIEILDKTYQNCQDVIWAGDIILTDKYKLYQVTNAYPTGSLVNEYNSWTCKCNVMDLAKASLPNDYRKIVERNRYGLPKVKKS